MFFSIPYWWVSTMAVAVGGVAAQPTTRRPMQPWLLHIVTFIVAMFSVAAVDVVHIVLFIFTLKSI
jgi:hypothetical protein